MTKSEKVMQTLSSLRSWTSTLNESHLISLFGFSCYLIWELFGVFAMLPFLETFFSFKEILILRITMFLALFITFILVPRITSKLTRYSSSLTIAGGLAASVPLCIAFAGSITAALPFWVGVIAWAFFGASLAFLMYLWAIYFETAEHPRVPFVASVGTAVSFIVFLFLSLAKASQSIYLFIGLLLVLSTIASRAILTRYTKDTYENDGAAPLAVSFSKVIHSGAYGIIYGFALAFLLSLGEISVPVGAAGGLVGCILAWVMISKNNLFDATYLRRITFAPVVVAVLFLPIGGAWSYIVCGALIISACICTAVASWVITTREVSKTNGDPLAIFCLIKAPGWFGIFLGTFIGSAMLVFAPNSFPIATTVLAAIICVSFSFFELIFQEKPESPSDNTAEQHDTRFQKRCMAVVEEAKLSPRESEVFQLLAKGRNAEHIAQTLCVAKPTAKTHIQHIYQKLEVNSHQELIDLLDAGINTSNK